MSNLLANLSSFVFGASSSSAMSASASSSPATAAAAAPGDSVSGVRFDLGRLGSLVRLHVPEKAAGTVQAAPDTIVVLDRSGSMSQWSQRFGTVAVPNGLRRLGCKPTDRVVMITFDSYHSDTETPTTVGEMKNLVCTARGTTHMRDVPKRLTRLLGAAPTTPFRLIAISDGQLSDKEESIAAAKNMAIELSARTAPTEVLLIRALTSSHADPDTRALACLGVLNKTGTTPVVDVAAYSLGEAAGNEAVSTVIATSFKSSQSVVHIKSAAGRQCMRLMPGTPAVDTVTLSPGVSFLLLDATPAECELVVGDKLLEVRDAQLNDEQDLSEFLNLIEAQIRMRLVSTGDARELLDFCQGLNELLLSLMPPEKDEVPATPGLPPSLKQRAATLRKQIIRQEKSMMGRILSLKNAGAVASFTAAQQADFLRSGAADTKAARNLAKRATRAGAVNPDDFEGLAKEAVSKLAEAAAQAGKLPVYPNQPLSFYSHSTFEECFEAARECEEIVDDLSMAKIMEMMGGVGVAFEGPIGEFVDPWQFRVNRVYLGQYLSQADLWLAFVQSRGKAQLMCPGMGDAPITGVDLVRAPHPALFDLYVKNANILNQMHASAFMRRKVAIIPYDTLALKTAVTLRLVGQCLESGNDGPSAALMRVLVWEILDLHHCVNTYAKNYMQDVVADLQRADNIGAYLTGDRDVNGSLKPLLCLLADSRLDQAIADKVQTGRILRALHALDAYSAARFACRSGEPTERTTKLHELLGIDLARGIAVGAPFEPDPDTPVHPDTYDLEQSLARADKANILPRTTPELLAAAVAVRRALSPLPSLVSAYAECLTNPKDKNEPDAALMSQLAARVRAALHDTPASSAMGVDCSPKLVALAHVAQGLLCSDLQSRVSIDTSGGAETRVMKLPDIDSAVTAKEYLAQVVSQEYSRDFEKRLAAKKAEEKAQMLARLINLLCDCDKMSLFMTEIQKIPDRSAPGFNDLQDALLNRPNVPGRIHKLWVLALGRTEAGEVCWASGNVLRSGLDRYHKAFERNGEKGRELWAKVGGVCIIIIIIVAVVCNSLV